MIASQKNRGGIIMIALGIIIGIAFGIAATYINYITTKKSLDKGDVKALSTATTLHTAVDIAALGAAFLMKFVLPINVMYVMVPAAVAASTGTLIMTVSLTKKLENERKQRDAEKNSEQ